eukprot:gene1366-15771_t
MTKCAQSPHDFFRDVFTPSVAVLTSEDVEIVCQKNELSFVDMIRPFCHLSNEVHIRDPVNPNVVIPIRNFKLKVQNLNVPSPPSQLVSKVLSEVVAKSVTSVDLKTTHSLETLQNGMIVVSTRNPDPMGAFVSLSAQQTAIQQSTSGHNPYVKWFSPSTFKYYVLVHDVSEGHEFKADAVFQSMKSVYGSHTCFLLQINSKPKVLPNAPEPENVSDPWSRFLYPFDDETLDIGDDNGDDDSQPDQHSRQSNKGPQTQAEADKEEARILENFEKAEKLAEESNFSPSLRFQDPLTSMHYNENLENDEINDLGPLKPGPPDLVKDIPQYKRRLSQVKLNEYKKSIKQFSFEMLPAATRTKDSKKRGTLLTLMDIERVKTLVYEFCVRGLLLHIEKLMRNLSEQILSRKGLHRSIFNVTKKWFGGSKSTVAVSSQGSSAGIGISYPVDSAELQQRKLGDLAFLVQHYELAFNSYHAAKREFNNDHAWLYFAGALEMAAISAFMQGPQRTYPVHYFEACISTYLNTCRLPEYATRACLMSTEVFKYRNMFADAAFEFIKLTNEDCDLRSALLLEQASHCYLHNSPPMTRKYAFNMILAGHRFSKSVQRKHTLRCYTNALNIYKDKGWHFAEDHMNFIIGRQCFNLGQLDDSKTALRNLLIYESCQPAPHQASHLREYLAVFKQSMEKKKNSHESKKSETLPVLPLPKIDGQATRVILSAESAGSDISCDTPTLENPAVDQNRTRTVVAGHYSFRRNYNKNYIQRWSNAEKQAIEKITGSSRYPWRPAIPFLSNATDNSYRPACIVGEICSLEIVFVNPLRIPLNLLGLHLLWEFTPDEPVRKEESKISNQLADYPEYISTDVIENFIVKAQERKSVPLNLKFHKTGSLKVTGVKYVLSSISVINAVDDEGKIDLNGVQDSTLLTFGVKGQQMLEVKGPRLNSTKKEKTSVTYGNDYRLNPRILPSVPKLQAWMVNFPVTLLCGEVRLTQFVFKNSGKTPLKNLYISCNKPESFSVDMQLMSEDLKSKDNIYKTVDGNSMKHSAAEILSPGTAEQVIKVPLEDEVLLPNAEIIVPVWIHGTSTPGVHELDFLFYYEPVNPVPGVPYRVTQQTIRLQTLATLNLSAAVKKSSASFFKGVQEETSIDGPSDQTFIGLHVENRAQGSAFPRCVEFTVLQVSCFSKRVKFMNVGKGSTTYQKLRPGEALLMYLKAYEDSKRDSDDFDQNSPVVSHIPFTNRMIDGAKSPAIDFFNRAPSAANILDAQLPAAARIGIAIFWQTSYIDDACVRHTIYGQTHTGVYNAVESPNTFDPRLALHSTFQSADYDIVDSKRGLDQRNLSAVNVTNQIKVTLQHDSSVMHNFDAESICRVPVCVTIYNTHEKEVMVFVTPRNTNEGSNKASDGDVQSNNSWRHSAIIEPQFNRRYPSHFTTISAWVGKTAQRLKLQPFAKQSCIFDAVTTSPGVYDLNAFQVIIIDNKHDIVVKKTDDESVVHITDSSNSLSDSFSLSDNQ